MQSDYYSVCEKRKKENKQQRGERGKDGRWDVKERSGLEIKHRCVFKTDKNTSREIEEEESVELSLIGMMGSVWQISVKPSFS